MYVCMYNVCMYVSMYIYVHVCVYTRVMGAFVWYNLYNITGTSQGQGSVVKSGARVRTILRGWDETHVKMDGATFAGIRQG